jgi:glutathione S-transferase
MRVLYHLWLSAGSRLVRLALAEKNLDFDMRVEKTWERRPEFLALNPAGDVPVLIEPGGSAIVGASAIGEYLDEVYTERRLILGNAVGRGEIRRLVAWFEQKFDREVTSNLVEEKMMKRFLGLGEPNSAAIRAGLRNLHTHLEYLAYLAERRTWLAGDHLTLADLAAAAHLSTLDYLGDVPWDDHPEAKEWYARVKSRPSFRPLLADHIPGAPPPKHYADLDF